VPPGRFRCRTTPFRRSVSSALEPHGCGKSKYQSPRVRHAGQCEKSATRFEVAWSKRAENWLPRFFERNAVHNYRPAPTEKDGELSMRTIVGENCSGNTDHRPPCGKGGLRKKPFSPARPTLGFRNSRLSTRRSKSSKHSNGALKKIHHQSPATTSSKLLVPGFDCADINLAYSCPQPLPPDPHSYVADIRRAGRSKCALGSRIRPHPPYLASRAMADCGASTAWQ